MVDFTKNVLRPSDIRGALNSPFLDFKREVSETTGELKNFKIAKYKACKIKVFDSGYAEFTGSIHKYKNGGIHNADDFTFANVVDTINVIKSELGIDLWECKLSNIEIGVNITPPTKPSKILNGLLIHSGQAFKDVFLRDGNYKQAGHSQYFVKTYNKGIQYRKAIGLDNREILRFELKFYKMATLNKVGLFRLKDVFNPSVLEACQSILRAAWSKCLLFDNSINRDALKGTRKEVKYYQWQSSDYWMELPKQRRYEQLKCYRKMVDKYSDNIHEKVKLLIVQKWIELTENPLPNYRIINMHFVTILPFYYRAS